MARLRMSQSTAIQVSRGRIGWKGNGAIDLASRKVVGRLDFGHGVRPHCILMNPNDGLLYVTTELDRTVTIVDPNALKIVGTIPTGQEQSHMLAISHNGRFATPQMSGRAQFPFWTEIAQACWCDSGIWCSAANLHLT